jgi:hypothetical protein
MRIGFMVDDSVHRFRRILSGERLACIDHGPWRS